jgi:hypothetical protein
VIFSRHFVLLFGRREALHAFGRRALAVPC